jgi:RNA polymerase sigma-70 factor (ECF subfamily)
MFENAQASVVSDVAAEARIPSSVKAGDQIGAWLQMTAVGDHEAFRCLYDSTARRMLGQAISILRDRDAAEDALQDAFVRIWSSARHYNPERGHALAWMTRIMRNVAIDRLRSRRHAARYFESDENRPEPSMAPEPIDERLDLIDALDALSPEQRNTIRMIVIHGWTHEELGLRDGIPTATTKSRVQRGLRRLRASLDGDPAIWSEHSGLEKANICI